MRLVGILNLGSFLSKVGEMSPRGAGVYIPPGTGGISPKKKTRPPKSHWIRGVGVFWLAGFLFWGLSYGLCRYQKGMLVHLKLENQRLSARIEALRKHPELYEEIARKKYGYVKENERLIIFGKEKRP